MARFFMVISVIGVFCFYANTSYSLQQGKIAEVKPSATTNQSLDVRCGTSKDPQKANCGKKPDGLKGKGWEANAKVRGGQIEKILTDASISIEKKADKIFNLYDTVGNFSAMNYEFCWMYKNGVISCTRYNDLVDKVMPLIVQPKTSSEEKKVEKKEPPEAITLTSMRVTWRTTGDDKDWNTQPVIDVFDRLPISSDERVKIQNTQINPTAAETRTTGIMRFHLDLGPGQEEKITIKYRLIHPEGILPVFQEGGDQW